MGLLDVYAVELGRDNKTGEPVYEPRSQALPTAEAPKLWVNLRDAKRAAERSRWGAPQARRVVKFALVRQEYLDAD